MKKEEFFLVVRFKKVEKKKLFGGIVFEPIDVITASINNGNVTIDGKTLPCLESFEPTLENDEFYAFPIKVCERIDGGNVKITNEEFLGKDVNVFLKDVKNFEYAYTSGTKDEQFVSMIYAIRKNGELNSVDFSKSFYANFLEFLDEDYLDDYDDEGQDLKREDILNKMYASIVSQDEQVKVLVDTVLSNQRYAEYEGLKENLMIIGPTGTGKTLMCRTLSKILKVPIIIKDATKYSSTGYVGLNVVDMLEDLCREADYDLDLAERGIIVIDEFDKLGKGDVGTGSNVRTKDVQHELLGMLDGGVYTVNIDKNTTEEIDTSNITFVLAGAFQDILQKVSLDNKSIGFGGNISNKQTSKKITREDLAKYGGIERELLRRISSVIQMNPLYEKELKQILTTSKTISEIKAKILDGELSNCEVEITEETVKEPTKYLIKKKEKGMKNELPIIDGENY